MTTIRAFDEIIDFITTAPQPQEIVDFKPSKQLVARVELLLEKKKTGNLNEMEEQELDRYMMVEHIMRLAKARARKKLGLS